MVAVRACNEVWEWRYNAYTYEYLFEEARVVSLGRTYST